MSKIIFKLKSFIELEFNNRLNPNIFMFLCYTLMDKVNQIIEL